MRQPKATDPEMVALYAAERALQRESARLQREVEDALRPMQRTVQDALAAVQDACDVPPGLVLDEAHCQWLTRDPETGKTSPMKL